MIIFKDKSWQRDTFYPNKNYLEGINCEQPKWVINDNEELAKKIMSMPYWDPLEDENGNLIDVIESKGSLSDEEKAKDFKEQLAEIDKQAIRPLRAIAAGTDTEEDRGVLADLERKANDLRVQLEEQEKRAAAFGNTLSE